MENINLCECLKDMSKGTKLYSIVHGNVSLLSIEGTIEEYPIGVEDCKGYTNFTIDGKYLKCGEECVLFPSKEMRDWSKFFKHGDIVKSNNLTALFDSWVDTTYTRFYAKYVKKNTTIYKDIQCSTKNYSKVSEDERMDFIKEIENYYKGNLNLETLEIEYDKKDSNNYHTLKTFDKVLVRNNVNEKWLPSIFLCYEDKVDKDFSYICLNGRYCYCIPYERNEYLLGTNKDYKQKIDYRKDYCE